MTFRLPNSRTSNVATEPAEQPVFGGRHGAGLLHAQLARGPGFAIEAPRGHSGLERCLKGRDQRLKLGERQAGAMQELRGAGLQIGTSDTSHAWCLLSIDDLGRHSRSSIVITSTMSMRFFMLTCTVGLLSWGGTCDGISVYYHQKPRPGNPRRASKICDTTVLFSRTPQRMHIALFKGTPAGAQRGHREDPG